MKVHTTTIGRYDYSVTGNRRDGLELRVGDLVIQEQTSQDMIEALIERRIPISGELARILTFVSERPPPSGRPAPGRRTERITIRVTRDEKERLGAAAAKCGRALSAFMLEAGADAAKALEQGTTATAKSAWVEANNRPHRRTGRSYPVTR